MGMVVGVLASLDLIPCPWSSGGNESICTVGFSSILLSPPCVVLDRDAQRLESLEGRHHMQYTLSNLNLVSRLEQHFSEHPLAVDVGAVERDILQPELIPAW